LERKFTSEGMVSALSGAFAEAGIQGDVQITDCTEYPCIACGNIGDDQPHADINAVLAAAKKLGGTQALGAYQGAARKGTVFTFGVLGTDLERTLFCQAFYPPATDSTVAAAIEQRLAFRFERIKAAWR
jgi:hypothetical protein